MGQRVGLFGAIEIRFSAGPVLLNQAYDVSEAGGQRVASMRMMLRSMKAASPQLYPELASARG